MAEDDASKKRRLFVGTFLARPDMDSLGELREFADRMSAEWNRTLSWVRAEKLHLTWLFLGDVEERDIDDVKERLGVVLAEQRAMELNYSGRVFWPNEKQPRSFVLVPNPVPAEVVDLQKRIDLTLRKYVQKRERKGYRPHITILRVRPGGRGRVSLPPWFPIDEKLPIRHVLNRIDLIESHLAGDRSYQSIAGWDLPGSADGPSAPS